MTSLSACLIVKNEEKNLERAVRSVLPICDEVVIVDTGSSDKTVEIAESLPKTKVYHHEWDDDFSSARNYSLEMASSQWLFVIDADEIISSSDYENIIRAIQSEEVSGYYMLTRNYTTNFTRPDFVYSEQSPEAEDYIGYTPSHKTRIFRNNPNFKFRGRLHEVVDPSIVEHKGRIADLDVPIHHYGCKDFTWAKVELYRKLAEKKAEDEPDNPMAHYELGQVLIQTGNTDEGLQAYEKGIELNPNFGDFRYGNLYCEIGNVYLHLKGDIDKALEYYLKAIEMRPGYKFVYSQAGNVFRSKQQYNLAEAYLQEAILLKSATPNTFHDLGLVRYNQHRYGEAAKCFERVIEMAPSYIGAYNNLGINYHLIGQIDKAEECWSKGLELDPDNVEILNNLKEFRDGMLRKREKEKELSEIERSRSGHTSPSSSATESPGSATEARPAERPKEHPEANGHVQDEEIPHQARHDHQESAQRPGPQVGK